MVDSMDPSGISDSRTPLVVACAVIMDEAGLILAALRPAGRSLGGKWEFPGGKVEVGESPASALLRELSEELEISAQVVRALSVVRHDYPDFTIELHPFVVRIVDGIPKANEHAELRWIRREEAPTLDWAAADLPILNEI